MRDWISVRSSSPALPCWIQGGVLHTTTSHVWTQLLPRLHCQCWSWTTSICCIRVLFVRFETKVLLDTRYSWLAGWLGRKGILAHPRVRRGKFMRDEWLQIHTKHFDAMKSQLYPAVRMWCHCQPHYVGSQVWEIIIFRYETCNWFRCMPSSRNSNPWLFCQVSLPRMILCEHTHEFVRFSEKNLRSGAAARKKWN